MSRRGVTRERESLSRRGVARERELEPERSRERERAWAELDSAEREEERNGEEDLVRPNNMRRPTENVRRNFLGIIK